VGGWLRVSQGDNVKLRDDEGSGASGTGRGVLHRERESLGERARSLLTVSAGSSCSSTTKIDGSGGTGVAVLSFTETVSAWCAWLASGWATFDRTSLTGVKQRETFTEFFLF